MTNQTRDNTVVIANVVGCQHCHQAIAIETPLPLDVVIAILRAFADLHQFCHIHSVFTPDMMVCETKSEVDDG